MEEAFKQLKMPMPGTPPQAWLDSFSAMISSTMNTQLEPLKQKIEVGANQNEVINNRVNSFESRLAAVGKHIHNDADSTAASEKQTVHNDARSSTRIEIKGWCKRNELKPRATPE
eukprot:TRINITY_DN38755_c0_g1_i1.p2 TRINITY_DN38755_c0_g1~~TRINITY_DN38755_c0_g1_i1.p2  ORF type:complete len:115 (-),score=26.02 TRINITY_DN38755_c0_g1_i1:841-1185(-)